LGSRRCRPATRSCPVNGSDIGGFTTENSHYTVTAAEGDEVSVTVKAVNPDYPANGGPAATIPAPVKLLPAAGDEDGDGMSNEDEDTAGTNPLDNGSVFKVDSTTMENDGDFVVTWTPAPGRTYAIQTKTNLSDLTWTTADTNQTSGSYTDTNPGGTKKFYRVVVE